jgi:hypothetical protein
LILIWFWFVPSRSTSDMDEAVFKRAFKRRL